MSPQIVRFLRAGATALCEVTPYVFTNWPIKEATIGGSYLVSVEMKPAF